MKDEGGTHETVESLLERLAGDPDHQAAAEETRLRLEELERFLTQAEAPVVDDLQAAGIQVESAWDLMELGSLAPEAASILVRHLETGSYPDRVMEGLARALAVRSSSDYWPRLLDLYRDDAMGPDAREGLAVALAASAKPKHGDDLISLVQDAGRGPSRLHLLRAISRVGGSRGRQELDRLSSDPFLGKEARKLLRRKAGKA